MQKIVVVGAGVVGSSLAFRLAQAGQDVTLVDRGESGWGTSGSSFAWTNSNSKTPEDYFALNLAGMQAHLDTREELGEAPWFTEGGNLLWSGMDASTNDMDVLESRVARLRSWDYPAEWLSREQVRELEPHLQVDADVEQAAFFPTESWVDGPQLARAMTELARKHGATVLFGCEVTAVDRDGDRITGVRFANGQQLPTDLLVNCGGAAADIIAKLAGRNLPLAPTKGLIVRVSHAAGAVNRIVHAPTVHMRPDGDLLMLHHGDADDAIMAGESPAEWASELLRRAQQYLPVLADARISRWSVGTRPIPDDGRTSAGLVDSLPGYAEVVTHSGVTLSQLLAKLVTRQIVEGDTDPLLAPFTPNRFA
ncbi:MAG: FAD-binding oxidoreductase [Thermomicrobiales bacterium]|nr:FAD-binding oxidoreductase [Thermomicrobiales bacterium]